jgi:hypothetical protein
LLREMQDVNASRDPRESPRASATAELVGESIEEAKVLLRIELALARDEALAELAQLREAGVRFVVSVSCAMVAVAALVAAAVVASGCVLGLVMGGLCVVVAVIAGASAWRKMPAHPFARTRARLARDLRDARSVGGDVT